MSMFTSLVTAAVGMASFGVGLWLWASVEWNDEAPVWWISRLMMVAGIVFVAGAVTA